MSIAARSVLMAKRSMRLRKIPTCADRHGHARHLSTALRTIRENIAYGRPDASDEEIIVATKQAQAWDFHQRSV